MSSHRREDFLPHVGTDFIASDLASERRMLLRLESVEDTSTAAKDGFSLFFSGAAEMSVGHDTYAVTHPALGRFSLFLGPVLGGTPGRIRYQAVFSRLK